MSLLLSVLRVLTASTDPLDVFVVHRRFQSPRPDKEQVRARLSDLVRDGLASKTDHGTYEATRAGRERVKAEDAQAAEQAPDVDPGQLQKLRPLLRSRRHMKVEHARKSSGRRSVPARVQKWEMDSTGLSSEDWRRPGLSRCARPGRKK